MKHPLQYLFIFQSIVTGEKREELLQSYKKDMTVILKEEIFNFMTQLVYFVHDGYIASFTDMFFRIQNLEPTL